MVIQESDFLEGCDNDDIRLITLGSHDNIIAQITNHGARLVSLFSPNAMGKLGNIVVGYTKATDFMYGKKRYFGATIGRYANRIANATIKLDNQEYKLEQNHGKHQLHGGSKGFGEKIWKVIEQTEQLVRLRLISPHGDSGYPGVLVVEAIYKVLQNNTLEITYRAKSDRQTVVNLTNHSYFNLSDNHSDSIYNHHIQLDAKHTCEVDEELIPTGRLASVDGTYLDLRNLSNLNAVRQGKSYDHHYILDHEGSLAKAIEMSSGRAMTVKTSKPGLQFYTTDNITDDTIAYYGQPLSSVSAFCFETQFAPDAMHHEFLDDVILDPSEVYEHVTIFDVNPNTSR